MRLFIAINFNEEIRNALMDIQDAMMHMGIRGNYTKSENLHLTLAFIGDYPDQFQVKEVIDSISFEPFEITLDGVGSFGKLWWAGIQQSEQLRQLAKSLRHKLSEANIPFDRKKFSPHITLVRNTDARLREGMPIEEIERNNGTTMAVDHISLMRSDRGKHGMVYTEL